MLLRSIKSRIVLILFCALFLPVSFFVIFFIVDIGGFVRLRLLVDLQFAVLISFLFFITILIIYLGLVYLVVEPLNSLKNAMAEWHRSGAFSLNSKFTLPSDVISLSNSIHSATLVLQQRERELQAAFSQQDLLMQEIHHRVKNNLQIIASLMNLQASRIKLPEARAEFQSARDRVRALATVHRHLYAHGELHSIKMREFLIELCGQLFQAMGETAGDRIQLEISAPELQISSDQAVPLSLIVTEAVSNAIKYAFPKGRHGHILVSLVTEGENAELTIQDNGIGVPAGRVETESGTRDGIGITLIRGFARQLGATLTVEEDAGTRYVIRMKLRRDRIESPPRRSSG